MYKQYICFFCSDSTNVLFKLQKDKKLHLTEVDL